MTKDLDFPPVLFISGIGTDVGKSIATGWLAREMRNAGLDTITQKMVQTGNIGQSEDIVCHRRIMGIDLLPEDEARLTAPVIFSYPASPHLAAAIDKSTLDLSVVDSATEELSKLHSHLLIEGAGGLMVPLIDDYLTIDYIRDRNLPVALVVNGQLGSINHALLSLYALKEYGITVFSVIYNPYFDKDKIICADTRKYLQRWLGLHLPHTIWIEMPTL